MAGPLKVATYNIHHGAGLDGVVDLGRIASAVRATEAEVVGLQELDDGLERSGRGDQARDLAAAMGLEVAFFPTLEREGGRYGLGIVTAAAVESHYERLPRRGKEEPRGVLVGRAGDVWVVVTHLSRDRFSGTAQLRALASMVAGLEGPVVVMGDLNQGPRGLGPLTEVGVTTDGLHHRTWGSGRFGSRGRHIDHVLAGGGAKVGRSWTVDSDASDHVPLVAEVVLP